MLILLPWKRMALHWHAFVHRALIFSSRSLFCLSRNHQKLQQSIASTLSSPKNFVWPLHLDLILHHSYPVDSLSIYLLTQLCFLDYDLNFLSKATEMRILKIKVHQTDWQSLSRRFLSAEYPIRFQTTIRHLAQQAPFQCTHTHRVGRILWFSSL